MPFVDDQFIDESKNALRYAGLDLINYDVVIASKKEARECLSHFKKMDDLDAIVLFSGTWVWAAHLTAGLRDVSNSGKGILIWTHLVRRDGGPWVDLSCTGRLKKLA
jgi:hypothetical protein